MIIRMIIRIAITISLNVYLAITPACEVIPPLIVRIPIADFIPTISSGEVSCLHKITFSPLKVKINIIYV